MPISKEMKNWWNERHRVKHTPMQWVVGGLFLIAILFVTIPWQSRVTAEAVVRAVGEAEVVSAVAGQIQEVTVRKGDPVKAGDPVAIMISPELDAEHRIRDLQLAEANILLDQSELNPEERGDYLARLQEMRRLSARIEALDAREDLLVLTAPIAGTVREMSDILKPGHWIGTKVSLARIVDDMQHHREVVAYVSQREITRIGSSPKARFYPEQVTSPALDVRIDTVERLNSSYVDVPILTTPNGGAIAATRDREGRYVPLDPVFKVTGTVVEPSGLAGQQNAFSQLRRGSLQVEASPESMIQRLYEAVVSGVIREMVF